MKTLLTTVSATVLAAGLAAGPVHAQSDQGGDAANQKAQASGSGEGRSASEITCREITVMDTAQVPTVLYYIVGHGSGMEEAGGGSGGGSADVAGDASGGDGSGGSGAASGGTESASDTSGGSGDAGDMETADASAEDASGSGQGGDGAQIVQIRGFYEIPVEQTLVACGERPDSKAGDVMREQREAEGS